MVTLHFHYEAVCCVSLTLAVVSTTDKFKHLFCVLVQFPTGSGGSTTQRSPLIIFSRMDLHHHTVQNNIAPLSVNKKDNVTVHCGELENNIVDIKPKGQKGWEAPKRHR